MGRYTVENVFFYVGKVADRLCAIDAAAGNQKTLAFKIGKRSV